MIDLICEQAKTGDRMRPYVCLALVLLATPLAWSARPVAPLSAPEYSFDIVSPKAEMGLLAGGDVLVLGFPDPEPAIPGYALGFQFPGEDELDCLSGPNPFIPSDVQFALLFSIDRNTTGLAEPDMELVRAGVPYSASDQAARGQAAGDQFMSTGLFVLDGKLTGGGRPPTGTNNSSSRNNFNEGGTSFSGDPPSHSRDDLSGFRVPQDNVDAMGQLPRVLGGTEIVSVYFSARANSPSLPAMSAPEPPSGANIFFNPAPMQMMESEMFATYGQLGLTQADDIDALIVFDSDQNGRYTGGDGVVFSLAPGSPSLDAIPGASPIGAAADVFIVRSGQGPVVLALAAWLGLGAPGDNIDALDFTLCPEWPDCILQHSIRAIAGDWDDDADLDRDDFAQLFFCLQGPEIDVFGEYCYFFDFDFDSDADLVDFASFQEEFTGSPSGH